MPGDLEGTPLVRKAYPEVVQRKDHREDEVHDPHSRKCNTEDVRHRFFFHTLQVIFAADQFINLIPKKKVLHKIEKMCEEKIFSIFQ